jgi:hypothetical protein
MTDMDQRAFGKVEAKVEQMAEELAAVKATLARMETVLQQAQGGWRLLMWLGGGVAAAGAAIGAKLAGMLNGVGG